jgi:penicillin-binding protein 1B
MAEQGLIAPDELKACRQRPSSGEPIAGAQSSNRVPAFMDLVRQQLQADYQTRGLQSLGLRIFTTLDPRYRKAGAGGGPKQLTRLERQRVPSEACRAPVW